MAKKTKTTKKAARRLQRATPTQLAEALCQATRGHPERLAALAAQLAQCAEVRFQLRAVRKQLAQLRAAPTVAPAPAASIVAPTAVRINPVQGVLDGIERIKWKCTRRPGKWTAKP